MSEEDKELLARIGQLAGMIHFLVDVNVTNKSSRAN